jgi:tetratricopeptide repeat protein 8
MGLTLCCDTYDTMLKHGALVNRHHLECGVKMPCQSCRYNLSHVSIGLGDKNLAYQSLKVAISLNSNHAEALNNLGILEFQRGNADGALRSYAAAQELAPGFYEPHYNGALTAFKGGELEKAYGLVQSSLKIFPQDAQSAELLRQITSLFSLK